MDETFTRGSGPGGQHRNKTETCVVLKHKPSNITVRIEDGRSQKQNRELAMAILRAKLVRHAKDQKKAQLDALRKDQAGSGMRGDKVRTIMVQHNRVVHHETNKECTYKEYTKGKLALLWR